MDNQRTLREEIIEVANKLFVYTDQRAWQLLKTEVFAEELMFDMSSLGGGEPKITSAEAVCQMWNTGFEGLDAIHHHSGNFILTIRDGDADIFCYATATHYKKSATQGQTRAMVGSYDLHVIATASGWRIDLFKYNLKFIEGNAQLI